MEATSREVHLAGAPIVLPPACDPAALLVAGQPFDVRVVALGDRPVVHVSLHHRAIGDDGWHVTPMPNRFRHSYCATIPAEHLPPCLLEWYVEASDELGRTCTWPAEARDGRHWTAVIEGLT